MRRKFIEAKETPTCGKKRTSKQIRACFWETLTDKDEWWIWKKKSLYACSSGDTPNAQQRGPPQKAKDVAMQDTGAGKHPAKASNAKESDGKNM